MEIKRNNTSIFIVPTLEIPQGSLIENGYINGFITDKIRESSYKNCIFMLFKPPDFDKFSEFLENEYENNKNIVEDYNYEKGYIVVVYSQKEEYIKDYELIKQGAYSKTSKKFQDEFPQLVKVIRRGIINNEPSLQMRIFKKHQELIDFWEKRLGIEFKDDYEVWEGFNNENEELTIDKLI